MLRALGGVICLASSFGIYRSFVRSESRKLDLLDDVILLMQHIRDKVDYYSAPIDKILSECDSDLMTRLFSDHRDMDIEVLFSSLSGELDIECEKAIRDFTGSFGKSYREGQVLLCDGTLKILEARRDKMREMYISRKKVAATLTLVADGIIFIALL